jgi:hypothetical protein
VTNLAGGKPTEALQGMAPKRDDIDVQRINSYLYRQVDGSVHALPPLDEFPGFIV